MGAYKTLLSNLKQARDQHDLVDRELYLKSERLRIVERLIHHHARDNDSAQLTASQAEKTTLEQQISGHTQHLSEAAAAARDRHLEFTESGRPHDLVAHFDDGIPILLLPVRVEARYMTVDIPVTLVRDVVARGETEPPAAVVLARRIARENLSAEQRDLTDRQQDLLNQQASLLREAPSTPEQHKRLLENQRLVLETQVAFARSTEGYQDATARLFESQAGQLTEQARNIREMRTDAAAAAAASQMAKNIRETQAQVVSLTTTVVIPQEELWVRVFPDVLHIDTHEEALTPEEIEAGGNYWSKFQSATGDALGAWRVISRALGAGRAAYVLQQTDPSVAENPEVKSESWTRAARTHTMPDRFVVTGIRGTERNVVVGNPIPDPLIVGPNPQSETAFDGSGSDLIVDDDLRWTVDFDRAVEVGMGVRMVLDPEDAKHGFDRLIVLGVRESADENDGQEAIESLIQHQRHSPNGFALVAQGTPTNNTELGKSGLDHSDRGGEISKEVELVSQLPGANHTTAPLSKRDGEWLAEALGIEYGTFSHIAGSGASDTAEAMAMNHALWPATLGFFMEQMLRDVDGTPLFTLADIDATRQFFTECVLGRGRLPAFRVGDQPYGILPATVWSRVQWNAGTLEAKIHEVCVKALGDWEGPAAQIQSAGSSGSDWQASFLDVLGLHATSVEFYQRYAAGPKFYWNLMNYFGWSTAGQSYADLQSKAGDLALELGLFPNAPRILQTSFQAAHSQLTGPLVDEAPPSESDGIKVLPNYISWLLTSPLTEIRNEDFGGEKVPRALLYLMLRHAWLMECWDGAMRILTGLDQAEGIERQLNEFLNFGRTPEDPCEGAWHVLFDKNIALGNRTIPVHDFVLSQQALALPGSKNIAATQTALGILSHLPTARLERAFAEHLDLCSHRLDAWLTGLLNRRLDQLRTSGSSRNTGLYFGAYGWLLNLRPASDRTRVDDAEIPGPFVEESGRSLTFEEGNAGFVHGPSINHAIAAAILRNGYVNRGGDSMAVNLSSRRVRLALGILDGIKNGQDLAALLGYRLQRNLHEGYPGLELDATIHILKEAFPLTAGKLTSVSDTDTNDSDVDASEARDVLDGLTLLKTYQANGHTLNWGSQVPAGYPAPTTAEGAAIVAEIESMAEVLDALADLTMAEGVFQIAKGNHDRAGAILNALGEGSLFPDPEIVRTPRTGYGLTHRVGLLLDQAVSAGWVVSSQSASYRAAAEPSLNGWLSKVIGDPATIRCRVHVDEDDNQIILEVGADQLGLQPIDLLYILNEELADDASELARRISYAVRSDPDVGEAARVSIPLGERNPTWGSEVRTFAEILPLVTGLARLIKGSRPLHAGDFVRGSENTAQENANTGYDLGELGSRLQVAFDSLDTVLVDLTAKLAASTATADDLRDLLLKSSMFGLYQAVPVNATGTSAEVVQTLMEQGEKVREILSRRRAEAVEILPDLVSGSLPTATSVADSTRAMEAIFGRDFVAYPQFSLRNTAEVEQAWTNRAALLAGAEPWAMDAWLSSTARVRARMTTLEQVILLADTLHHDPAGAASPPDLRLEPVQFPYHPDGRWLGAEFDDSLEIKGDTLSVALCRSAAADFTAPLAGLFIDEWVEKIPTHEETTGVAFNYAEPESEPPQSLLLAVSPQLTGKWDWSDVFETVNETIDLARRRAMEPATYGETAYGHLLSSIIAPVTFQEKATISLDFRRNIMDM